jgi:hypothetical protein
MLKSTRLAAIIPVVLLLTTTGCTSLSKYQSRKAAKLSLASYLQQNNAKMYGATWCVTCTGQKKWFGKEAFSKITYIECDPAGKDAKPELCRKLNINSFPTWEVNGKLICIGGCSLDKLADESGYKGPRDF